MFYLLAYKNNLHVFPEKNHKLVHYYWYFQQYYLYQMEFDYLFEVFMEDFHLSYVLLNKLDI